ncbi:hypothetical protein CEXT_320521 [Caerostris extrusa]|uniref:Uncharacterized protein n=1 Tax=Caerostris extrusa TaxID=172846 RepID=A0AAV4WL06_CAEEX|nr:hypothetical protein CEXT_320521 [Caerostris extrusa]
MPNSRTVKSGCFKIESPIFLMLMPCRIVVIPIFCPTNPHVKRRKIFPSAEMNANYLFLSRFSGATPMQIKQAKTKSLPRSPLVLLPIFHLPFPERERRWPVCV